MASAALRAPPANARVMVVDDVETNRALIARLLRRRDYQVIEMESGFGALVMAERDPPDLVLLDLQMPRLSGVDTLRLMRKRHDSCALPIIMVTAEHDADAAAECLSAGANDYVTKPVQWAVLRARIETQLSMRRAHAQLRADRDRLLEAVSARTSIIARIDRTLEQVRAEA